MTLTACSKDDYTENDEIQLTNENIDIQLTNVNFGIADIDFIDINYGYIIDNQGRILNTENSGDDWNLLHTSNYELLDIQFITKQNGYVLAKTSNEQSYFLLKTSDYGESFQETSIPNGSDLRKIYFTNNNIGFVLGSHILKTVNNGSNWTELNLDFNVWGDLIEKSNGELYACGLNGTFLKSTNTGVNWEQIDLGINSHLYQIQPFQDIFYFRGQNITKTNIETTQEFEIPAYIKDFKIYKENIVIGFGEQYPEQGFYPRGAMYISNNSGDNWETTIFNEFNRIRVVDFIDSNNGFGIADDLFSGKEYLIKIKIEE
ncbi:hypothetical protein N9752_02920 [Polaribacter sp.]|jgi:hypothetical protein|nr:hypothetical protein [Polaribacter sp.]|tara:strand:+ start:79 stop:1029 length:951 start_codon:yes stop_codon:yes gene_type:complete